MEKIFKTDEELNPLNNRMDNYEVIIGLTTLNTQYACRIIG